MIYNKLPNPAYFSYSMKAPEFTDHLLLTEQLNEAYHYPEHKVGFGIISLLKGEGKFYLNNKKIILNNRSYLVVNRDSQLSVQLKEKYCEPSFLYFNTRLPELIARSLYLSDDKLIEPEKADPLNFSLLERPRYANASLIGVLKHLSMIGQSCASFHALKADLLIRSLLEKLCLENDAAVKASYNINAVKKTTREALYMRVITVKDWMEEHYDQNITLDKMAKIAMMNSQHFLRVFKQTFQITPHQHLISFRLSKAQQLLAKGDDSITSICGQVGFESLSSFSWLFKQSFYLSPTEYRQKTKSKTYPAS